MAPGKAPRPGTGGGVHVERAGIERLDELMAWRETVLREVFSIPEDADLGSLLAANRTYYERELPGNGHVACLASIDGHVVGCGGICLQGELPSPDNPSGKNAYLRNVYTVPAMRGAGVGKAVVGWLVGEARRLGAGKVYLESSEAGKRLYADVGFAPLPAMYHLPIRK